MADLNNDGLDEIITLETSPIRANTYTCRIGFHSKPGIYPITYNWFEIEVYLNPTAESPRHMFTGDFNGNGLIDIMFIDNSGYKIYWNQGTDGSSNPFSNAHIKTGTNITDVKMMRMGDFNGDGLPDFILNATNSNIWNFALNNGDGTFTIQQDCILDIYDQSFTEKDEDKFEVIVFDFDNDGQSDVVIHKAMYNNGGGYGIFNRTHTYWMRSTGTGLEQKAYASSSKEDDGLSRFIVAGDFNGDGQIELMNYGYTNLYSGSASFPGQNQIWRMYKNPNFYFSFVNYPGKVWNITDGAGNSTTIDYASLVNGGVYTKGSGSSYPVNNIIAPLYVVKQTTSNNTGVPSVVVNYSYSGAKLHIAGKGFLGMTSVKAINQTMGITTESGYNGSLHPTFFIPTETYSKTTIGNDFALTTTNLTIVEVDNGSKKFFAYPNQVVNVDMDENTTTATYQYNTDHGYITQEKTEFGGSNMYRTTQYGSYILAGGAYKPELITVTQKHLDDSQPFTNITSIAYDITKGYPISKIENFGSDKPLKTEYAYDIFGNITSSKISGSGIKTITNHLEYDATNRFVAGTYTTPASTVATFTYDIWGNVLTETDATNTSNLLTTTHTYNNWGRKTSTTFADNTKTTYRAGRYTSPGNNAKRYYSLIESTGQPWVLTWYDAVGRETSVETVGAKNMSITATNSYNSKGQVTQTQSVQGQGQGSLTITETFTYDSRGRLELQSSTSGQSVNYVYDNRSRTTTIAGQQYTQTFDAWGNIKTSSDPLNSVLYNYYSSGNTKNITAAGGFYEMEYDDVGNRTSLSDPNAGITTWTHDAAGRIVTQTDAKNNVTQIHRDRFGRDSTIVQGGIATNYTYGTSGNSLHRLTMVETGDNSIEYTYDDLGRIENETRTIVGETPLTFNYQYNSHGALKATIYPGGVQAINHYDENGNLERVRVGSRNIWELKENTGTLTKTELGGSMTATREYNSQGHLSNLKTVLGNTVIRNMDFVFHAPTGNLTSRTGMINQKETFYYDDLDRLTTVNHGTPEVLSMSVDYDNNGNIQNKTGLGQYTYGGSQPHAVTEVENENSSITRGQEIIYNSFNKAEWLIDTLDNDIYMLNIDYGVGRERVKYTMQKNGTTVKNIIFAGDYEKITENGVTKELIYMPGGAIYVKQTGQADKIYYAHVDNLGSVIAITDGAGTEVFKASYDAWGKQTLDPANTFNYHRGYTGHVHLPEFQLIDMDGRLYDYNLGRFLSPDPYVADGTFSQDYNRYTYARNNPNKFIDPDGEWNWLVAGIGFVYGYVSYGLMNNDWGWKAAANGGLTGLMWGFGYTNKVAASGTTPLSFATKSAVSSTVNSFMPSMNIPVGNNGTLSFSPSIVFGTHQAGLGYNLGYTQKIGDFSVGIGGRFTNYSSSFGPSGSSIEQMGYWSVGFDDGTSRFSYSSSYYDSGETSQRIGMISYGHNDFTVSYQNDYMFRLPADGGDRFRTAAARVQWREFSAGVNFFTGDPGLIDREKKEINGREHYIASDSGNPNKYRAGIGYVGYGNMRIGRDSERIRHIGQNRFAHDFLMRGNSPHFSILDINPTGYFYVGARNPYTLW